MISLSTEQMIKYGVMDYYLELKQFINNFANENYPLTKKDFTAIVNNSSTDNIKTRNKIITIMTNETEHLLRKKMKENMEFIDSIKKNKNQKAQSSSEYQNEITHLKQLLLCTLYNHTHQQKSTRTR